MLIGQPAPVDAIFFLPHALPGRSLARRRAAGVPPLALSLSPGQPARVAPITAGLPKKSSRRLRQDTASFPSPERRRACGPDRSLKFTSERHCFFFCFFLPWMFFEAGHVCLRFVFVLQVCCFVCLSELGGLAR